MTLFGLYPASPAEIAEVADGLVSQSRGVVRVKRLVGAGHRRSMAAVDGDVQEPLAGASRSANAAADSTALAALVAAGALRIFAAAVMAYNTGVKLLNHRYAVAATNNFFVDRADYVGEGTNPVSHKDEARYDDAVTDARRALLHHLAVAEATLNDDLDRWASFVAAILNAGPSDRGSGRGPSNPPLPPWVHLDIGGIGGVGGGKRPGMSAPFISDDDDDWIMAPGPLEAPYNGDGGGGGGGFNPLDLLSDAGEWVSHNGDTLLDMGLGALEAAGGAGLAGVSGAGGLACGGVEVASVGALTVPVMGCEALAAGGVATGLGLSLDGIRRLLNEADNLNAPPGSSPARGPVSKKIEEIWDDPQRRRRWVKKVKSESQTRQGPEYDYQRKHAGDEEYLLESENGETIWADGVEVDPDRVVAIEAKFIKSPGSSLYEDTVPSTVPAHIREKALSQFDDEIRRYREVIESSTNPVSRLRLVVSNTKAAETLASRARQILGPGIDLDVVIMF